MNKFGIFNELGHAWSNGTSINDYISDKPFENQQKVVDYLRSGNIVAACPGIDSDVLSKDDKPSGVPNMLTDGKWLWFGDLPYYVENYNLKPPPEMLQNMQTNSWRVPGLSDEELIRIGSLLFDE